MAGEFTRQLHAWTVAQLRRRFVRNRLAADIRRLIDYPYLGDPRDPQDRGAIPGRIGIAERIARIDPAAEVLTPFSLVCYPSAAEAPYGWGEPFTAENRPLGAVLGAFDVEDVPMTLLSYGEESGIVTTREIQWEAGRYSWDSPAGATISCDSNGVYSNGVKVLSILTDAVCLVNESGQDYLITKRRSVARLYKYQVTLDADGFISDVIDPVADYIGYCNLASASSSVNGQNVHFQFGPISQVLLQYSSGSVYYWDFSASTWSADTITRVLEAAGTAETSTNVPGLPAYDAGPMTKTRSKMDVIGAYWDGETIVPVECTVTITQVVERTSQFFAAASYPTRVLWVSGGADYTTRTTGIYQYTDSYENETRAVVMAGDSTWLDEVIYTSGDITINTADPGFYEGLDSGYSPDVDPAIIYYDEDGVNDWVKPQDGSNSDKNYNGHFWSNEGVRGPAPLNVTVDFGSQEDPRTTDNPGGDPANGIALNLDAASVEIAGSFKFPRSLLSVTGKGLWFPIDFDNDPMPLPPITYFDGGLVLYRDGVVVASGYRTDINTDKQFFNYFSFANLETTLDISGKEEAAAYVDSEEERCGFISITAL